MTCSVEVCLEASSHITNPSILKHLWWVHPSPRSPPWGAGAGKEERWKWKFPLPQSSVGYPDNTLHPLFRLSVFSIKKLIYFNWRLITLQHGSGFLGWVFTSHLPHMIKDSLLLSSLRKLQQCRELSVRNRKKTKLIFLYSDSISIPSIFHDSSAHAVTRVNTLEGYSPGGHQLPQPNSCLDQCLVKSMHPPSGEAVTVVAGRWPVSHLSSEVGEGDQGTEVQVRCYVQEAERRMCANTADHLSACWSTCIHSWPFITCHVLL